MRIFECVDCNKAQIKVDFCSSSAENLPMINIFGSPLIQLPIDKARDLARKILLMPVPLGYKEPAD